MARTERTHIRNREDVSEMPDWLKEACQLFTDRMLDADVTVGMSISGALTPAGLGCSSIIPLIKAGFVDWIVSTGANLYHDLHFALNYPVHSGSFC